MKTIMSCIAVLAGAMGVAADAAAGNSTLDPLTITKNSGSIESDPIDLNVPPQDVPVMIAQANQAQPSDVKTTRTLGICFPAPNDDYSLENVLVPALEASVVLFAGIRKSNRHWPGHHYRIAAA